MSDQLLPAISELTVFAVQNGWKVERQPDGGIRCVSHRGCVKFTPSSDGVAGEFVSPTGRIQESDDGGQFELWLE